MLLCTTLVGYLLWTFIEYVVHRFVLHHIAAFRELHKAHHDASHELLGTPTIFSVSAFYFLGYLPIAEFWGTGTAAAILTGLLVGYLSYVIVHYALHHTSSHGFRIMKRLKRRHALHHQLQNINFGVTTDIWDRLCGTFLK
jgi:sterol desaturase/sphingolipid hydroxylase (fatty acid hydroxylase superfamily)